MDISNFEELRKIWVDEGTRPVYHREQQKRLRNEWPMLYKWMVKNFGPPGKPKTPTPVTRTSVEPQAGGQWSRVGDTDYG